LQGARFLPIDPCRGFCSHSAYDFLVSEAANGEDWIDVRSRRSRLDTHVGGCGFQSSFWAENVTLRTRGSTVYRLFRQKVPIAGARTSHTT
jgi:hypothetical protein